MSPYLVLLILEFFPARLATLPYGLDSNVTQLLANLLTKPSVFYYLPSVSCNLVSIKLLLLLLLTSETLSHSHSCSFTSQLVIRYGKVLILTKNRNVVQHVQSRLQFRQYFALTKFHPRSQRWCFLLFPTTR